MNPVYSESYEDGGLSSFMDGVYHKTASELWGDKIYLSVIEMVKVSEGMVL